MKSTSKNQFALNLGPPVKLLRDPNERALRLRQVSQLTGLGRSMIYQMQAEGRFPQRIKLGERAVVISAAQIEVVGTAPLATLLSQRKALVAKYIVR
jgi:predicted DNA-binding transcriptional regulator AlpA